ncbi:transposase [Virgisporangium aurantiacum]
MKHYSAEFRADAVALYHSRPDATIRSVAEDLGVNPETLRNWIRLADGRRKGPAVVRAEPAASAPGSGSAASQVEAENAALRRRVRELEEERDILRKAARYFAGETRW